MNIEDLKNEWGKDSIIIDEKLDTESINTSRLHSKYLNVLSDNRLKLNFLIQEKKILENVLEDYFEGKIDGKDIKRPPFTRLINTKAKIEKLIASDNEYQKLMNNINIIEETILFVKEVITSINKREFAIRNAIEYKKFISGN